MFELGEKFGFESLFKAGTQTKTISKDYYPSLTYYTIERGQGWKGSPWERVYKILRDKSPTYLDLITPYEKDSTVTYTFQSTEGSEISTKEEDHTQKAVASTYINLSKYKKYNDHLTFIDRLADEYRRNPSFHLKLHITTDFFDNERNRKLNDLGRAIILIHEGVHASIHYSHPFPEVISDLHGQHQVMGKHYLTDIQKSLKQFDSRLTEKERFTLSISGLTAKKAEGNQLIAQFAEIVLEKKVKVTEEDEIEAIFKDEFLPMFRRLTEQHYEIQKK